MGVAGMKAVGGEKPEQAGEGQHKKEGNGGYKTEAKGISFTPDGGFLVLDIGLVKRSLWIPVMVHREIFTSLNMKSTEGCGDKELSDAATRKDSSTLPFTTEL